MRKSKKSKLEEVRSGQTSDLRNVIAEIQKVDQETADLSGVVKTAQQIDRKRNSIRKDTSSTYHLLFSSIMDKVFLILLLILFSFVTYLNFKGDLLSSTYGFWIRFLKEIGILFGLLVTYIIFNWLYNCINKTSLSVSHNGVYIDFYFPFFKKELYIPLEHITAVSTIDFIWIFRGVVIKQYGHLPMIFFTWDNAKCRDRLIDLMGNRGAGNFVPTKSLLQESHLPVLQWISIIFLFIIFVLGMIHFFGYIFSFEKKLSGTYLKGNEKIILNVNGTCDLKFNHIKNLKKCNWILNREEKTIEIKYEYMKNNYYGEAYKKNDIMTITYGDNKVIYKGIDYKKK